MSSSCSIRCMGLSYFTVFYSYIHRSLLFLSFLATINTPLYISHLHIYLIYLCMYFMTSLSTCWVEMPAGSMRGESIPCRGRRMWRDREEKHESCPGNSRVVWLLCGSLAGAVRRQAAVRFEEGFDCQAEEIGWGCLSAEGGKINLGM